MIAEAPRRISANDIGGVHIRCALCKTAIVVGLVADDDLKRTDHLLGLSNCPICDGTWVAAANDPRYAKMMAFATLARSLFWAKSERAAEYSTLPFSPYTGLPADQKAFLLQIDLPVRMS